MATVKKYETSSGARLSPVTLLMPNAGEGDEKVEATGVVEKCDAERFWGWLVVYEPLDPGVVTVDFRLAALPSWKRREMVDNIRYVNVNFSGEGLPAGKAE